MTINRKNKIHLADQKLKTTLLVLFTDESFENFCKNLIDQVEKFTVVQQCVLYVATS